MQQTLNTVFYRWGKPFPTGAIVATTSQPGHPTANQLAGAFTAETTSEGVILRRPLMPHEVVLGLGQCVGSPNRRGRRFCTHNTDHAPILPDRESLYGSHPFLIILGDTALGVFIDYPGDITFDVGFSCTCTLEISVSSKHVDVHMISAPDLNSCVGEFLRLVGKPWIPPKWAFGYQQSRWSYPTAKDISAVASRFRTNGVPCDAISLDLDYMDGFKVFTVSDQRFPDFESWIDTLAKQGFRIIPIIDPGVKIEPGYQVYESGIAAGAFCEQPDGTPFVGAVWPGLVHFPDFLNPDGMQWWANHYANLADKGVGGFWNDMNEPAIFFEPNKLTASVESATKKFATQDGMTFLQGIEEIGDIINRPEDLRNMLHKTTDGERIPHLQVHNLYGFAMAKASVAGLQQARPKKRHYLISRSSYIGQHRICGVWTGDNSSWWEHLSDHLQMLISLGLCGFFYSGADVGGFLGSCSGEMLTRWTQLGIFSPLCRNHSALGTPQQEPWAFCETTLNTVRCAIRFRYALLPYTYSEFMRGISNGTPLVRHVASAFNTDRTRRIDDAFLYGDSLLVCPILRPNSRGRMVHLPATPWALWRASDWSTRSFEILPPGDHFVTVGDNEIPLFIRENSLVVLTQPQEWIGQRVLDEITVIGFVSHHATFLLYDDDGENLQCHPEWARITVEINAQQITRADFEIIDETQSDCASFPNLQRIHFEIVTEEGTLQKTTISLPSKLS